MREQISAAEAIDDAVTARLREVWTALPGVVVSFDAAGSTAVVQPIPADYVAGEIVPMPVLHDVPVAWPRGGGAAITWPLSAGDRVLLVFAARCLDRYRGDGAYGDPQSIRTHDLSDAIALPLGLWPDASVVAPSAHLVIARPTGAKVLLGASAGTAAVARDGDNVAMGSAPATWGAWASQVSAALTALGQPTVAPVIAPTVTASSTTVEAT